MKPAGVTEPTPPASLLEVQRFLNGVFRHGSRLMKDEALSKECAVHVTGNDRLTPAEQVDIYRRQFWIRHDESLREDFPALCAVLEDDLWQDFVHDYLQAHPPRTPSLRDLGADVNAFLPRWLETIADTKAWGDSAADRALLCREAAAYELSFVDVFDGADPPPLSLERLGALTPEDWERAKLVLSPLVHRMRLHFPVHRLRLLVKKLAEDAEAESLDVGAWMKTHRAPQHLAVFRKDFMVHFEELSPDAFAMLDALAEGDTLLGACARVAEGKPESEAQALGANVGEWFRRWASWGFIADIVVPKP